MAAAAGCGPELSGGHDCGRGGEVGQRYRDRLAAVAAKPGQQAGRGQANDEPHQQQEPADLPGPEARPLPSELVAQHQDLQILVGITACEQGEQLAVSGTGWP
jgi:hypothetical protein